MGSQRTYRVKELEHYLKSRSYHLTYRQGNFDAFYNPRNRQYILLPVDRSVAYSKEELLALFAESEATDLPPKLEYYQFVLHIHTHAYGNDSTTFD